MNPNESSGILTKPIGLFGLPLASLWLLWPPLGFPLAAVYCHSHPARPGRVLRKTRARREVLDSPRHTLRAGRDAAALG